MGAISNYRPLGCLCDDHVHVKAEKLLDMGAESWRYRHRKTLVKMANNPILSDECRDALWKAVHDFDAGYWWKHLYITRINKKQELTEQNTAGVFYEYGAYWCDKCGTASDPNYLYCPGCGQWIEWGEEETDE